MARDRNYKNRKIPKQSRTVPLYGSQERGNGEDANRYYRCWNCGFTCDKDRDVLGGSTSRDGLSYTDYTNSVYEGQAVLGGHNHVHVVLENGADGLPKSILHSHKVEVDSGCPFCGTLNWRGDYP